MIGLFSFIIFTWALVPLLAYIAARHRGWTRWLASCAAVFGVFGLTAALMWPAPHRPPRHMPKHAR